MDLRSLLGPVFPMVEPVLGWVVGMDYPEGDPDRCVHTSKGLVAAAGQIRDACGEGDETLQRVLRCAQGPAADALSGYWRQFTVDEPAYVEELAKACEEAARQLEGYGLDIDYTQKYIALSLVLLGFFLLRCYALAPATGGASFWAIGPACTIARMNVRTIAKLLLMCIAFMVGLDGTAQTWQMAEGKRTDWDESKTVVAIEGGLLTGLAFAGLGVAITRLAGPGMAKGLVAKADMTAREKVAAFLSQTTAGVATQSSLASVVGSLPMLISSGQLTPLALAKAATSGFVGGIDGRAGYAGPRATGRQRLPRLPDPPNLRMPDPTVAASARPEPYHNRFSDVFGTAPPAVRQGGELVGAAHHFGPRSPDAPAPRQPEASLAEAGAVPPLEPRHRELIALARQDVHAGISFRHPDSAVMPSADMRLLRQSPDLLYVGIEGAAHDFRIGEHRLSAKDLGTMLAHDPRVMAHPEAELRILGCETALNPRTLQELADITGRTVSAGDKYVYIGADRLPHTASIVDYRADGRPVFRDDGAWHKAVPERPIEQPRTPFEVPEPRAVRRPLAEEALRRTLTMEPIGETHIETGAHGRVDLLTFADGTQVIRKTMTNHGRERVDTDVLASLVGQAFGAPVPHVIRDPLRENVVYMDVMEGVAASSYRAPAEFMAHIEGHSGVLLGLFDVLVSNPDRSHDNWFVSDSGPRGIDLTYSFETRAGDWMHGHNIFARHFLDRQGGWIDNPLSRQDVELITERMHALRPAFERLGRGDWHDVVMDRLYQVADHASGRRPLLDRAHDSRRPGPATLTPELVQRAMEGRTWLPHEPLGRGGDGEVARVYFLDYTSTAILKEMNDAASVPPEMLGSLVGRAFGAPVPRVLEHPLADWAVFVEEIVGKTALEAGRPLSSHPGTRDELLIGLLDVLTANHHRTNADVIVTADGRVFAIDHGKAFDFDTPLSAHRDQPFTAAFLGVRPDGGFGWIDNPLTRSDIDHLQRRLTLLRPEFESRGQLPLFDLMMHRLDELGEHATGTEPLLGLPQQHFGSSSHADVEAFNRVHDDARARFDRGERIGDIIPYQLKDATGGLGARDGGRPFGIELEYALPGVAPADRPAVNAAIARDLYQAGLARSPDLWPHHSARDGGHTAAPDSWRLETERGTAVAGEVVSPILYDEPRAWHDLARTIEIIRAHGGRPGPEIGSHIHIGVSDYAGSVAKLYRLLEVVKENQDVLFRLAQSPSALDGLHRGFFACMPNAVDPSRPPYSLEAITRDNSGAFAVSMADVHGRPDDHVQLRLWDGTLDPSIVQTEVMLSLALVESGLRSSDSSRSPGAETVGTHYGSGLPRDEDTGSFRRLLDELPLRPADKERLIRLFAITEWQPSVLQRYALGGR
ncbi:hypothetical protein AB0B45_40930 [Nonomuraea sp. NPDC049152]|uniref:WXG100-like domain-containing protein n=1 Tax=Nonomuraea sp. NPDC049152 TaxID=3154350 RepID=UPI0033C26646